MIMFLIILYTLSIFTTIYAFATAEEIDSKIDFLNSDK